MTASEFAQRALDEQGYLVVNWIAGLPMNHIIKKPMYGFQTRFR
jgi:hypothetical protein